jgi:hypothetical protein
MAAASAGFVNVVLALIVNVWRLQITGPDAALTAGRIAMIEHAPRHRQPDKSNYDRASLSCHLAG